MNTQKCLLFLFAVILVGIALLYVFICHYPQSDKTSGAPVSLAGEFDSPNTTAKVDVNLTETPDEPNQSVVTMPLEKPPFLE